MDTMGWDCHELSLRRLHNGRSSRESRWSLLTSTYCVADRSIITRAHSICINDSQHQYPHRHYIILFLSLSSFKPCKQRADLQFFLSYARRTLCPLHLRWQRITSEGMWFRGAVSRCRVFSCSLCSLMEEAASSSLVLEVLSDGWSCWNLSQYSLF